MELIRGLHNLRARHRGGTATIGNFDGMHRGHQLVVAQAVGKARTRGSKATVIAFEPMPAEFFAAVKAPPRLMRLREKYAVLAMTGVEQFLCLRFDRRLAGLSADDFVEQILVEGLAVTDLVVGDDFRYGKNRVGDFQSLVAAGRRAGFSVTSTRTFDMDGERVSSSAVRRALGEGKLQRARVLLGRPYQMCGHVIEGRQLGRELGFPTANIALKRKVSPLKGVFAVRVAGASGNETLVNGVASLGRRPTVNGDHELLEVHLFDLDKTLYGRVLAVEFLAKLRDEVTFSSLENMQQQMRKDAAEARRVLNRYA